MLFMEAWLQKPVHHARKENKPGSMGIKNIYQPLELMDEM